MIRNFGRDGLRDGMGRLPYNSNVDWLTVVAIFALAATAACVQALSGFGFSLFIVPFLAMLIGPRDTVVLANMMSIFFSALQAFTLRHSAERRTAGILMLGSIVGMPVGVAVLLLLDPTLLQVVIASMVIVFTLVLMRGVALHSAGLAGDLGAGFISGVLNTSTSMSGPPVVLYLQGKKLPPLQFRATTATFFAVTSAIAVVLLLASGSFKPYLLAAFVIALPAIMVGQRVGNRFFSRIDHTSFRRMVYGILLLSGTMAVVGALL